jgi:hypothetical protein
VVLVGDNRNSSGSFAKLAAMRRASSRVTARTLNEFEHYCLPRRLRAAFFDSDQDSVLFVLIHIKKA